MRLRKCQGGDCDRISTTYSYTWDRYLCFSCLINRDNEVKQAPWRPYPEPEETK